MVKPRAPLLYRLVTLVRREPFIQSGKGLLDEQSKEIVELKVPTRVDVKTQKEWFENIWDYMRSNKYKGLYWYDLWSYYPGEDTDRVKQVWDWMNILGSIMKKKAQEAPEMPAMPDIGPPEAPPAPPAAPEAPGAPSGTPSPPAPISVGFEELGKNLNEGEKQQLYYLVKTLMKAITEADILAISYVSNEIKTLLEKAQKKRLKEPFFSVYSFLSRLEKKKFMQDKNFLVSQSAKKLSETLRNLGLYPLSSRILSIVTADYNKMPKVGTVRWHVAVSHLKYPVARREIVIDVFVNDEWVKVDDFFYDIKGRRWPFDSAHLELYAKGELR